MYIVNYYTSFQWNLTNLQILQKPCEKIFFNIKERVFIQSVYN